MKKNNREKLEEFRQTLYESFPYRQDSVMELIDALSGNQTAKSVAELSLNPLFSRQYGALYQAIREAYEEPAEAPACNLEAQKKMEIIGETIEEPKKRRYWLFGIDETPYQRLYAKLIDKQYIHQGTAVPGAKPVSVGHSYSLVAALPEADDIGSQKWAIPLSMERVSSIQGTVSLAHQQLEQILKSKDLPWNEQLSVISSDSRYSSREFVYDMRDYPHTVLLSRLRSNRVLYRLPSPSSSKGHPRWYGEKFDLRAPKTWGEAQRQETLSLTTARGKRFEVELEFWPDLLMRGAQDCPMHQYPFDVVRVCRRDEKGQAVFPPMWLMVFGQKRRQLSLHDIFSAYRQRFSLEHFFRFAKQRLLLTALQTPEATHEQNWVRLSLLAYNQLWVARHLGQSMPLPWQRYLPSSSPVTASPAQVQRDFTRIIQQFGTFTRPPKPRGFSPGRLSGHSLTPRPFRPLVKFHPSRRFCPCKSQDNSS